jgi:Family of unknown function (DUF5995)
MHLGGGSDTGASRPADTDRSTASRSDSCPVPESMCGFGKSLTVNSHRDDHVLVTNTVYGWPAPPAPPPITAPTTIDGVVEALGEIVDWSIGAASRLGYFAALYKRVTIAVGVAVEQGAFEDGPRMERLDVAFANRYFEALNGYFHPDRFPKPTYSWQVTFDAANRPDPIIVQHMLAGVNAHIALDLGVAAQTVLPGAQLPALRNDFNTINAVLASQVYGVVETVNELSPVLADLYTVLMQDEIKVITQTVEWFRDSAWRFALLLAAEPEFAHPATIWARDLQVSRQGALIYDPPDLIGAFVKAIAARESRDIVTNLQALSIVASRAAPIQTTM